VKQDAQDLATFLSEQLGGAECIGNLRNPYLMDDVIAFGRICIQEVADGSKAMTQLAKEKPDRIALVLYRCDEEDNKVLLMPFSEQKRLKGILKRWRSIQGIKMASFDASARTTTDKDVSMSGVGNYVASEELQSFVSSVNDSFVDRAMETRPGALVFFAGVPGCGKRTIVQGLQNLYWGLP
jgi:hypothetical protein